MKHMKKSLTLILCLLIVFSTFSSAFAGDISKAWEKKWADYDNNIAPAVTINGKVYPKLSVDQVPAIVEEYRSMGGAN